MENRKKIYWGRIAELKESDNSISGYNSISENELANIAALRDHVYKYDSEYMIDDSNDITELLYKITSTKIDVDYTALIDDFISSSKNKLIEYHKNGIENDYDSLPGEEI